MHPEMEPNYSKQRLIFRPKSLLLGWWGGMHPPLNPPLPTAHVLIHYNANYPSFVATGSFVTFINNSWKVISFKSPPKGKNFYFVQKIYIINCTLHVKLIAFF